MLLAGFLQAAYITLVRWARSLVRSAPLVIPWSPLASRYSKGSNLQGQKVTQGPRARSAGGGDRAACSGSSGSRQAAHGHWRSHSRIHVLPLPTFKALLQGICMPDRGSLAELQTVHGRRGGTSCCRCCRDRLCPPESAHPSRAEKHTSGSTNEFWVLVQRSSPSGAQKLCENGA